MSETVQFDKTHHPVIILRIPARGPVESIHGWYDDTERLLREASGPIGLVHDLRAVDLTATSAAHRRVIAERSSRLRQVSGAERLAADARVVSGRLAVGALTAVSWLTGTVPWPQATFSDEAEAIAWAQARIEEARRR